ncbi:phosphotransferase enzyme family protein [Ceratobasidium sp. AG-Ba]|nr:phosphotransferase enzyme family protein [Ceratobasidium sp. AG-Ba]
MLDPQSLPSIIPNLSTSAGIEAYLATTEFAAANVETLTGGMLGYTYRASLKNTMLRKSVFVKHCTDRANLHKDVLISADRMAFEYEALTAVACSGLFTPESTVQVPRVLLYDPVARIIIMEDLAPVHSLSAVLIEAFEAGTVESVSAQIGAALGDFMGKFYKWGAQPEQMGLRQRFLENTASKEISTRIRYSFMLKTAEKYGMKKEWMGVFIQEETNDVHNGGSTIIMGDLWPENILISTEPELRIYVVDWEMARCGRPEIDVGDMAAAVHSIAYIYPSNTSEFNFMRNFMRSYNKHYALNELQVAFSAGRDVMAFGADQTWLKSQDEGTKRKIVQCGLELLQAGVERDVKEIRNNLVVRNLYV